MIGLVSSAEGAILAAAPQPTLAVRGSGAQHDACMRAAGGNVPNERQRVANRWQGARGPLDGGRSGSKLALGVLAPADDVRGMRAAHWRTL